MSESTKDFIARELVILGALTVCAFFACVALMNVGFAIWAIIGSFFRLVAVLYGFRWVYWAINRCRDRAALRPLVSQAMQVTGIVMITNGVVIALWPTLAGHAQIGEIKVAVTIGIGCFIAGLALIAWNYEANLSAIAHETTAPALESSTGPSA